MKRIQLISVLLFCIVLSGCKPVVTFDKPQPEGVDSLTAIPKKLIGRYMGNDGASCLIIDRNEMILKYDYEVKQLKDSLQWEDMTKEERSKYMLQGDSVVEHIVDSDTLFVFSEDFALKKYKGYYFISSRYNKNSWFVQKLKLQKGILTIGTISTEDELKTLEKINESPIDTTSNQIKFSRKQFHEYIDNEGFSDVDTFVRVKAQSFIHKR